MTGKTSSSKAAEASFSEHPASLHHVGYVVASITAVANSFARSLGTDWDEEIIHDPLQEAHVTFIRCGGPDTPAMELFEPAGDSSHLHKFVAKGGGLHHVCYEVNSLDAKLKQSRTAGCLVVKTRCPRSPSTDGVCLGLHTTEVAGGIPGALAS